MKLGYAVTIVMILASCAMLALYIENTYNIYESVGTDAVKTHKEPIPTKEQKAYVHPGPAKYTVDYVDNDGINKLRTSLLVISNTSKYPDSGIYYNAYESTSPEESWDLYAMRTNKWLNEIGSTDRIMKIDMQSFVIRSFEVDNE